MKIILSAENIRKSFLMNNNAKLEILKGISVDIEENKITVIVGASGAGKSTLLHIMSGLDKPDCGKISINGTDIFSFNDDNLSKFRNTKLGFVFQFHHLLPEFTAIENVAMPVLIKGEGKESALQQAAEVLKIVGLEHRINHKPAELSGGEQQRIAIARALVNNPEIIFADEPTGNLDSVNGQMVNELFARINRELNTTFLIVTHNKEMLKIADNIIEMRDGLIV